MNGVELIAQERARQIAEEGWTPEHDDNHSDGEMALAGAAYACSAAAQSNPNQGSYDEPPEMWPWGIRWWKPKDPIRDLVRAGALIAAEIDRLQRTTPD